MRNFFGIGFRKMFHDLQLRELLKSGNKIRKIPFAVLRETFQFFQLGASDSRLHIGGFQIVTEVAVHIFVIVAHRQGAELFCKTASAGIVDTGLTPAIPSPVPV